MRGPDRSAAQYRETYLRTSIKQKIPTKLIVRIFLKIGIDILSRALDQVPSALVGLTSLFGMGRGDPHRNRRHKGI